MNKIFYFSGTGNTLYAAKKVASQIQNTDLVPIADLDRAEDINIDDFESIGIFFPVYCFGLPGIVEKFAARLVSHNQKQPYIYCLCTSGGMCGAAQLLLEDALDDRGLKLNAAFHVTMPSNYIPLADAPSEAKERRIIAKADKTIERYIPTIKKHASKRPLRLFPLDMFGELVAKRAVSYLESYDKYFWITEDCNGCEICKKVCPAANIIMMNGLPSWRGNCEQCMACLQWCPKHAIQFKQITLKRKRYVNSHIKKEEMFRHIYNLIP